MSVKQLNIFGDEDFIESLVDPKQFSQQAQDHIRLLRNLALEVPIIDRLTGLSPEEQKYIRYLRERMAMALAAVRH